MNNNLYNDIFGSGSDQTPPNNSNNNLGGNPLSSEGNSFNQNMGTSPAPEVLSTTPEVNNTPTSQPVTPPPLDNFPLDSKPVVSESTPNREEVLTPPPPSSVQSNPSSPIVNDEELLKVFIGNNYEKITTKEFNFAGFFFSTLYMFYRKMFLYAMVLFIINLVILNIVNNYFVTIIFELVVGLFVNKLYIYYAKNKIAKIKVTNQGKSEEELKAICAKKGGTSVGKIFIGFITEMAIAIVIAIGMLFFGIGSFIADLFDISNWNIVETDDNGSLNNKKLVENISISESTCINSKCNVSIKDANGNITEYKLNVSNSDLFTTLNHYIKYIKIDIYYSELFNNKTITNYKIYLKSTGEDISDVNNEDELRSKIGLYNVGTYTNMFTLKKIGNMGAGFNDDTSYTYITYTLVDSNNIEYEMKYMNPSGDLNLIEGNKYNITFEVTKGMINYDFIIKTIN